jgi:hypothetical protein
MNTGTLEVLERIADELGETLDYDDEHELDESLQLAGMLDSVRDALAAARVKVVDFERATRGGKQTVNANKAIKKLVADIKAAEKSARNIRTGR